MVKLNFQQPLCQSPVSQDRSEIILICWFGVKGTFVIIINVKKKIQMFLQDFRKFKRTAFILNRNLLYCQFWSVYFIHVGCKYLFLSFKKRKSKSAVSGNYCFIYDLFGGLTQALIKPSSGQPLYLLCVPCDFTSFQSCELISLYLTR